MRVPDTSVLVAGFLPAHPDHNQAQAALVDVRDDGALVAHTMLETHAVLTAAGPLHFSPRVVREYLAQFDRRLPISIPPERYTAFLTTVGETGVAGGAVYDASIAFAASEHGGTLVTLDRRAVRTYERVGADFEILANRN